MIMKLKVLCYKLAQVSRKGRKYHDEMKCYYTEEGACKTYWYIQLHSSASGNQ